MIWLDLSKAPVILSHPDMGDRYFTFELASLTSDNFACMGKRSTGGKAGNYVIAGPGWKGELPEGVQMPAQSDGTRLKNWLTTISGKSWFLILRMYGPLQPWIDQTWRPGEIELVN